MADKAKARVINNRYRVIKTLGEGGMGQVFLVEDTLQENNRLALKTISTKKRNQEALGDFLNRLRLHIAAFSDPLDETPIALLNHLVHRLGNPVI